MNNWLTKFDILLQAARVDYLKAVQAKYLAAMQHSSDRYAQASLDLVCASLHLSKIRGDIPQPVRNVIPTKSQSLASRLLFGRQGGWSSRNPGWMLFGVCVCICIAGVVAA